MCGRYTVTVDERELAARFDARFASAAFNPTFNAAPSQLLPVITTEQPHDIVLARWGFIPGEWKSSRAKPQNNARLETAAEKLMFRTSFAGRHCLVLAGSFYEWKTVG